MDVMSNSLYKCEELQPLVSDEIWSQYIDGILHTWLTKLLKLTNLKF